MRTFCSMWSLEKSPQLFLLALKTRCWLLRWLPAMLDSCLVPQEVSNILTERLTLKNPHKVWLAIELIKEVTELRWSAWRIEAVFL